MTVQAYILIQTEVGKAAAVAAEIADIKGVTMAEDVTGPYDVIVRAEARNVDELGKLVVAKVQGVAGHHPHADLPRRPPLSATPHASLLAALRWSVARHGLRAARSARHVPPHPRNSAVPVCTGSTTSCPTCSSTGQSRRRPRSPLVHAWGNVHPVVLRCGVPTPTGYSDDVAADREGQRRHSGSSRSRQGPSCGPRFASRSTSS